MKIFILSAGLICSSLNLPAQTDVANITISSGTPANCQSIAHFFYPAVCKPQYQWPNQGFPVPSIGGAYVDSNFGSSVTVLSEIGGLHLYSSPSPFSTSSKYLVALNNGFHVRAMNNLTGPALASVGSSPLWDASSDDIFYYFESSRLKKHSVSTGMEIVLADYGAAGLTNLNVENITGDVAKDNWYSFFSSKGTMKLICAVNLATGDTYCTRYDSLPVTGSGGPGALAIDFAVITAGVDASSGKRYVIGVGSPAMAVFSVNTSVAPANRMTNGLTFEFRGPENKPPYAGNGNGICDAGENCFLGSHLDVMEYQGLQYIMAYLELDSSMPQVVPPDTFPGGGGFFVAIQLSKSQGDPTGVKLLKPQSQGGGMTVLLRSFAYGLAAADLRPTNSHIGCARNAPICVYSMGPFATRDSPYFTDPTDLAPTPAAPLESEVFVIRPTGAGMSNVEMRRLANDQANVFIPDAEAAYWDQPRAAISPDGATVVWDTNFHKFPQPNPLVRSRVVSTSTGMGSAITIADSAVQWTNAINVTASPGQLTSNPCGNCYGGAMSQSAIARMGGAVSFTANHNNLMVAGLSTDNSATADDYKLDYAIAIWPPIPGVYPNGYFEIREKPFLYRTEAPLSPGANDSFRIAIEGGVVNYYRNNTLIYKSAVAPSYPLYLKAITIPASGQITNVTLTGAAVPTGPTPPVVPPTTPVQWIDMLNVTASSGQLTSNSCTSCYGGAMSQGKIAGTGGGVSFTANHNNLMVAGLTSDSSAIPDSNKLEYGIAIWPPIPGVYPNGYFEIREKPYVFRTEGPLSPGASDSFRIAVENGVVKYYRNNVLFYTSAVAPSYPLYLKAITTPASGQITNVMLTGAPGQ